MCRYFIFRFSLFSLETLFPSLDSVFFFFYRIYFRWRRTQSDGSSSNDHDDDVDGNNSGCGNSFAVWQMVICCSCCYERIFFFGARFFCARLAGYLICLCNQRVFGVRSVQHSQNSIAVICMNVLLLLLLLFFMRNFVRIENYNSQMQCSTKSMRVQIV